MPVALMVAGWGLLVVSLFNYWLPKVIGIGIGLALFAVAITMVINKNRATRISGIIILSICVLTFLMGFILGAVGAAERHRAPSVPTEGTGGYAVGQLVEHARHGGSMHAAEHGWRGGPRLRVDGGYRGP